MTEIEKIDNELKELREKVSDLYKRRRELEIEDNNFTGKYIYIPDYGYMYVEWQRYYEKDIQGYESMFFQGPSFDASFYPYSDENWFSYSALGDWSIPYDTYCRYIREESIKELTKEEFLSKFDELSSKVNSEFKNFIK